MKTYRVKEIFGPTLQGEGSHAGRAVVFLRFAGCNRWNGRAESKPNSVCYYCDTDFVGGERMTAVEIEQAITRLVEASGWDFETGNFHVVISGGEPTMQLDISLAKQLSRTFFLHLETNGSIALEAGLQDHLAHVTVSPKQSFAETKIRTAEALKFLYPWVGDGSVRPESFHACAAGEVFIQPIEGPEYADNLQGAIAYCLLNPDYRLSLQQHKILGLK